MLTRTLSILFVAVFALVLTTTVEVYALPTQVVHDDVKHCDTLFIPKQVDEIGDSTFFPVGEQLAHEDLGKWEPVCVASDLTEFPEFLVSITNLNKKNFEDAPYFHGAGKDELRATIDHRLQDDWLQNPALRLDQPHDRSC